MLSVTVTARSLRVQARLAGGLFAEPPGAGAGPSVARGPSLSDSGCQPALSALSTVTVGLPGMKSVPH